jgi:SAM-dependent methyltransferase
VVPEWVTARLSADRQLRAGSGRVLSALSGPVPTTRYDRHAAAYDRLVGSAAYNRFVWRSSAAAYTAYAAAAVADGDGPLLDLGCGTALFTAQVYRDCGRPVVLVDRSPGMLARAAERLGDVDDERVVLVQADLFELPFRPGTFTTTVSYGLLHLFDDPAALLRVLDAQREPDGRLYATSLVAETALAGPVLRLLHLARETAPPRRLDELDRIARTLIADVAVTREGGMAYLRAPARPTSP